MDKQKLPLGTGNKAAEEREYGPGWRDVHDVVREARNSFGEVPRVRIQSLSEPSGRWGLRVTVFVPTPAGWISGYGCFGPMFPGNGQKTMAAALWAAYNQLWQRPMGVTDEERAYLEYSDRCVAIDDLLDP